MTSLPIEHTLEVRAGDVPIGTLICTPDHLDELAIGWALAQGLQVTASTRIDISSNKRVATVAADPPDSFSWHSYLASGFDAGTLLGSLDVVLPAHVAMDGDSFERQVKAAFDLFREERGAGGYHHAALTGEDAVHCLIRDISRHNAVDKVVGHALLQGIDTTASAIVLSGRITTDIALKAARSGVPIVATRSLPTAQAVELAEAAGLMLACRVLDQRRAIYGPNRLFTSVTGQDSPR
jgi:FdhD protein